MREISERSARFIYFSTLFLLQRLSQNRHVQRNTNAGSSKCASVLQAPRLDHAWQKVSPTKSGGVSATQHKWADVVFLRNVVQCLNPEARETDHNCCSFTKAASSTNFWFSWSYSARDVICKTTLPNGAVKIMQVALKQNFHRFR